MISLNVNHPDVEEFIKIKTDLEQVNKANISLKITDEFMEAVIMDKEYELQFYFDDGTEYLVDGKRKKVKARDLFMKFAEVNWDYAEPGCLFWDRITKYNFYSNIPEISLETTNPCGEQPLMPYGSCALGSINLSKYVAEVHDEMNGTKKSYYFDIVNFEEDVETCVFALNDMILDGMKRHPLKQQEDTVRDFRQIGLGIMGLGDMLIKMGKTYGSKSSIEFCEYIAKTMINAAVKASVDYRLSNRVDRYGAEFATPYKYYDPDKFRESNFAKTALYPKTIDYVVKNGGMFNSQLLTCAPTGSLSNLLQISGGIEPLFSLKYWRKTQSLHGKDEWYEMELPIVKEYMEEHNISDIKDLPSYFITSHDIKPENRIRMQAVWQKYIDASISSTVNLNHEATVKDVFELYIQAWRSGLKGITIYRDGCARMPILTDKKEDDTKDENFDKIELKRGELIKPENIIGLKRTIQSGCGHLHCIANFDRETGDFVEVFLGKGAKGGCQSNINAVARLASLSARGGVSIDEIIGQLKSVPTCPAYAVRTAKNGDTSKGSSCPSAIAYALSDMKKEFDSMFGKIKKINEQKEPESEEKPDSGTSVKCPECGNEIVATGGCVECKHCGWTKCG